MLKVFGFIFFLSLTLASISFSRQTVAPDSSSIALDNPFREPHNTSLKPVRWYTMFERMPYDWGRWADLSFRKDKVEAWAWITALSAALVLTDDDTYTPSDRFYRSSGATAYWSDFFAGFGDGRTQFALAGAYAVYGAVFDDDRAFRTGSQIVEAVLASGAVVQLLKHVTGRESPFVRSTPTGRWSLFPNQIDYSRYVPYFDAFPSGHVCTALATVIVISENYPEVTWIRPLGYVLTGLLGVGMVNNGIHWYSDYPLGIFLGYYFGMIAAHPEGFEFSEGTGTTQARFSLLPQLNRGGVGISLLVSF
jgi:membrane-associated phospholipid phosphatase